MSKVLKTYKNGSELTIGGLVAIVAVAAIVTAVFTRMDGRKMRRNDEKYAKTFDK
jgi:hypothetical protein